MQPSPAFERLSRIHALALRLDALGADRDLIADCLGITPESVAPLLQVAAAKLAKARRDLSVAAGGEVVEEAGAEEAPSRPAGPPSRERLTEGA